MRQMRKSKECSQFVQLSIPALADPQASDDGLIASWSEMSKDWRRRGVTRSSSINLVDEGSTVAPRNLPMGTVGIMMLTMMIAV